ncbi:MAG: Spy/CpxP family protein refolding chaperone [Gemmatimonadaceae bacterium]
MRKKIALGLGLAVTLGAAGVTGAQIAQQGASAKQQVAQQDSTKRRGERGARGERRGPGGPGGFLLRGITLSADQQKRLEALRPARGEQGAPQDPQRAKVRALMDEARDARQRGDSAAAAAKFQQARTLMTQQREQQVAQIRSILTAEQRVQFDENVAEMKRREGERGQRGFGPGGERGRRGERGAKRSR